MDQKLPAVTFSTETFQSMAQGKDGKHWDNFNGADPEC